MKYESQLQITTAAAVPPLTVNQTALVTNFNADLLDGQHGAYYATAASLGGYLPLTGGTLTGTLTGTVGIFTTLRATELTSLLGSNGPITITPDGTGHVHINSTDIRIGPNNTNATVATRGTGDLTLRTNEGSAVEGYIKIFDGANGNIEITPNGTGTVVVGKLSGSTASFSGQITSTLASGTAPLVITSNTVVANLNSDFLDGQHGSFYQNAGNLNAGTVPLARLSGSYNIDITGSSAFVFVNDTRSSVTGPQTGYRQVRADFLNNSTDGLSDGGTYHGVLTFQQWADSSGGGTRQLAFTDNDNLWIRGSGTGLTAYNPWKLVLNSVNYSTYALPLSGGTLTGQLFSNSKIETTGVVTGSSFSGAGTGLTGTAASLTAGAVPWTGVTGKPTTLAGYGITDALPLTGGTLTGGLSGTTGSFSGQITSTVATGTAPFVVASTTQVNNLNAQLLGGQLSTYYAAASSLTNYLPLSGGAMTGALALHSTGTNGFYNGTGDAATYALYNFKLGGWNGMALENLSTGGTYPSQVVGVINFREGTIDMKGGFKVNGASVITENQSITISGDASGTGKTAINLTLASVGTAGTYRSVTTDAKGRVTAGTNPTTLAGYGITDALPLSGGTITGNLIISGALLYNRITDGTNVLQLGLWDASNCRIEASGRPLYMVSYNGAITIGRSSGTNLVIDTSSIAWGGNALLHAGSTSAPNLSIGGSSARWATGRTISITGDVTGTSGAFDGTAALSFGVTIANSAVTYAKIQNVATASVLGNSSASVAQAPSALSMATLAGMLSNQTMNINGSSASCTGNSATATTSTRLSDASNGLRIANPGGGSYATGASTATGAIKIKLPTASFKSNTMFRFTVKIYQYAGGASGLSRTIEIGGYNYSDAAANWYNIFAYQNTMGGGELNVRFGNDGTSQCVWIGELATVWDYPQVTVTDFQGGYGNYTDAIWSTGWGITFATAFDTVTQGPIVAAKPINSQNYSSYALPLTGGTVSGVVRINNQLQVGQNTNGTAYIDAYGGYAWFGRDSNSTGIRIDGSANVHMTAALNVVGAITQGGNQVLHAGNYNSYAPTFGGTGATGNWPINITGSATQFGGYTQDLQTVVGTGDYLLVRNQSASKISLASAASVASIVQGSASGSWGISVTGNAATVGNVSKVQLFNNTGLSHTTYTTFAALPDFGFYFMQGQNVADAPSAQAANQYYVVSMGLGDGYSYSQYAKQIALPRIGVGGGNNYLWIRERENSAWGSWGKVYAGYADSAGTATDATKLPLTGGTLTGALNSSAKFETTGNITGATFYGAGTGLTGTAASLTAGAVAWTGVTGKPTTLSGYGITDALPLTGGTLTGVLGIQTSSDNQLLLQGTDTWAGIGFRDSANVTDYIWYWGATQTFAIGGGGSAGVSGKKLHIDGGVTIGSSYDAVSMPTNGLNVEGAIQQAGNQVLHAGNYNSYAMLTSGIPSGSDQYVNFRVIRNSAASPADGMYIGYGNTSGGRTRIYGEGSTTSHFYPDSSGNLFRSDGVAYIHSSNVGNYIVPQTNYTTAINATGYTWIRIPYASGDSFNGGQSPIEFYVTRSIYDNSSTPYGGPTAKFVIQSMEWHSGQQMGTIQYGERGDSASLGAANWITHAKVTNMSGGGYWVYMRLRTGTASGVTYMFRRSLVGGQGLNLASIESTTDPGGAATIYYGFNLISAGTEARFYRDGNQVIDAGGFSGSLAVGYGSFTSPGITIGDAQYGLYASAGSLFYKSASTGIHNWRNIANNANTMSLDNNGNLTTIGAIASNVARISSAYTANNSWINAYFGGNIYWDGTAWQNYAWSGNNGWATMATTGTNGSVYWLSDAGTGNFNRTYTEAQFLAKIRMTLDGSGNFNAVGAITQNGNQVLHAGNFSAYALPLTGGTLTGALNSSAKFETTGNITGATFYGAGTGLTGTAASLTAGAVAWSGITSKPTTVSGYGITDTIPSLAAVAEADLNTATATGFRLISKTGYSSTLLTINVAGSSGPVQIDANYTGVLRWRNQTDSSSWTAWKTLLHDANYGGYSTFTGTVTGTNFSGPGTGLTGTAASLTAGAVAWTGVTGKPTTISGYGITDIVSSNSGSPVAADTTTKNGFYYVNSNISLFGQTDGGLFVQAYDNTWASQIYQDYRTGQLAIRGRNSGTWQAWRTVLDSTNFLTSAPNSGVTAGTYNNVTVNSKGIVTGGSNVSYITGNQSITLSGDVSGTGSTAITTTIGAGAVTYAKIQNVAVSTVLGNSSASVAQAPAALSMSTLAGMLSNQTMNINGSSASCTGNAATATNGFTVKPGWAGNQNLILEISNFNNSLPSGFYQGYQATNSPSATWYNLINIRHSNTANDHGFQLAMSYYDETLWSRSYQGGTGANNGTFTTWRAHLHSGNFSSYALPLTGGTLTGALTATSFSGAGTGLTGTAASLSIGGSAGSVAASGITGQTGMWTSAARPGPYRLYRRDVNDAYSVQNYWTGTYWRLDGYYSNDTVHAGCSVAYADTAGSVSTIADGAVSTTAKLANSVVTYAKIQNVGSSSVLGNTSASVSQAPQEITFSNLGAYINGVARAWVTFNENPSTGAITINASLGISSVTRINYGQYRVNFSTAFADANYAVSGTIGYESNGGYLYGGFLNIPRVATPKTTTYCEVTASYGDGNTYNARFVHVVFDR